MSTSGVKGSQRWIRALLTTSNGLEVVKNFTGHSLSLDNVLLPRKDDAYREFCTKEVLERLGLSDHINDLDSFWPGQGPRWDGVAKSNEGMLVLFEAKNYLAEQKSEDATKAKSKDSIDLITASLRNTAKFFTADFEYTKNAWLEMNYQYGNRLAMTYFLNEIVKIPTRMVYLLFIGDKESQDEGRTTIQEWNEKYNVIQAQLGLPISSREPKKALLNEWMHHVCIKAAFARGAESDITESTPVRNYGDCYTGILRIVKADLDRTACDQSPIFKDYNNTNDFCPESAGRALWRLNKLCDGILRRYCTTDALKKSFLEAIRQSWHVGYAVETEDGRAYPFTVVLGSQFRT